MARPRSPRGEGGGGVREPARPPRRLPRVFPCTPSPRRPPGEAMTANRRAKGRRLEKKEAEAWRAAGWTVEDGHPFRGMMRAKGFAIPRLGDLFERYDLMAAWGHTLVLIQVSRSEERRVGKEGR